jgi:hypothetical protein
MPEEAQAKKPRRPKVFPPPVCAHCGQPAVKATGEEIYGERSQYRFDPFWACWNCGAWVGSHPNGRAMGRPANAELRRARHLLHERFDPIWQAAVGHYKIASKMERTIVLNTARHRTYLYLADLMGMTRDECHIAVFDLEQCREAWRLITGLDYGAVRAWAKERKADAENQ